MAEPRKADAGVTLVEILVVLALIGISAGIVMYALPSPAQARSLNQEAALLTARLNLATERSLITGQYYRLDWSAQRYVFEEWRDDAWHSAASAPLSEAHSLGADIALSDGSARRAGTVQISPDLLPSSAAVVSLRMTAGAQEQSITFDGASALLAEPAL
jgi:general secretion pathway protein H